MTVPPSVFGSPLPAHDNAIVERTEFHVGSLSEPKIASCASERAAQPDQPVGPSRLSTHLM